MPYSLESISKASRRSPESVLGKLARLPLRLVPHHFVVPILTGKLRGKRWIAGSAIHRCWLGFYEYDKQKMISRELRRNAVFYDIGANVGFYSLLASQFVDGGKVFAFEPLPQNLAYLEKHIALNHVQNVEILALAVSNTNGRSFFAVERTRSMGCLASDGDIGIEVATATLDSLVEQGRILPPNCIKMDVEGAEFLALQGARETFRRYRPVLFLATHGQEVYRQCRYLLESWGYAWRDLGFIGDFGEVVAEFRDSTTS